MSIKVGILGISGYTGLELVKLILAHPHFELSYAGASSESRLSELFPQLRGVFDLDVEVADISQIKKRCELVFTALPHMQSMKYIKKLREHVKIVDLSADYRISLESFKANYGEHTDAKGLKNAVYSVPELHRHRLKNCSLVANPGCYPTASLLALAPFAKMIDEKAGVFIDAKSGVSGAGKSLKVSSHFISVDENANAYSPLTHRHAAEIKEHLDALGGAADVLFVPHLLPLNRGMLVSVYITLKEQFSQINPLDVLNDFYSNESFIRICHEPPQIKNVAGSHFADLCAYKSGDKIVVLSAIDNLLRGASSQALANANIICGFDESLALPRLAHFV
ncbi:N-acetyl-gamma-glutamyl-phosphate reductase [Campylobacter sp.]|uniref:N-acetyl-gamma-glutamyl-phosphate reductase n=1 Tax=Campylobacter sp. TaxID=205 RepID=UPI002A82389B|nr:N-acetyl-gamma-glutamyl-phosphate reductase [Campylobacter sp.]MDY4803724.1 N-acetyl-gamma-glutamyl-phosphate reductase [Campylobacter sp.]